MLKSKPLIVTAMLIASFATHADPDKSTAQNWLDEFRRARELSMNALTLKDPVKRRELMPKLIALRNAAEKLFGPAMPHEWGNCSAAANAAVSILENEIGLMTSSSQSELIVSGLATLAWEGAQQYVVCRDKIENIK